MSEDRRLTITVEGAEADGGHVLLRDFGRLIENLGAALGAAETIETSTKRSKLRFRVVDLSHSSPAAVMIEAVPMKRAGADASETTLEKLMTCAEMVAEGLDVPPSDGLLIRSLGKLSRTLGPRVRRLEVKARGRVVRMDEGFKENIERLLAPVHEWAGFMSGMLESINLHNHTSFRIFPDYGPPYVTCHVKPELTALAVASIGKFVMVHGILITRGGQPYPYAISAYRIEPEPEPEPLFADLLGSWPEVTLKHDVGLEDAGAE